MKPNTNENVAILLDKAVKVHLITDVISVICLYHLLAEGIHMY
jgi:hypothetical protein